MTVKCDCSGGAPTFKAPTKWPLCSRGILQSQIFGQLRKVVPPPVFSGAHCPKLPPVNRTLDEMEVRDSGVPDFSHCHLGTDDGRLYHAHCAVGIVVSRVESKFIGKEVLLHHVSV